jgi:hypothetical protein
MKKVAFVLLAAGIVGTTPAGAQPSGRIAERTRGLERAEGFIPFYWDGLKGTLLLEISRLGEDVLYFVSVSQGVGSVELGIDRGLTAGSAVIRFERVGPRLQVVQRNLDYRALGGNAALAEGVRESFAGSVLASLPIEAEESGRLLVDGTELLLRDAIDVAGLLQQRNQGAFRLDRGRSSIYLPRTRAFPANTEIETTLTFASERPGNLVSGVVPDGRALTLGLHHSFVQAPEGYRPRVADPRIGVSAISFKDYSRSYHRGTEVRWIARWRLEKQNPGSPPSEPKKPIVFYLDPGIPEPVRSAMREGALWWNKAFEAAGFRNAIQVKDPTPDIDPMDIRHSYILWVNRDERGFSNGGHFRDPRTGEILVAKPRMDSARVRTISNYWQAYQPTDGDDCNLVLPPYETVLARLAEPQGPGSSPPAGEERMVLARQALLTAHEVGHTLGFGHNWNSSLNDRASVMEYPTPRVKVTPGGALDLSQAFAQGVGAYDTFMTRYAYNEFPSDREPAGLERIIQEMRAAGILFTPASDPRWSWYDDLGSPTEYLRETLAARRILIDRYGPAVLDAGAPLGELRDMGLWMTYLHHRWAIESGVKYVGGMYHNLVVKGETLTPTEIVPAVLQREILALLMEAIQPGALALPERLLVNLTVSPYRPSIEDMAEGYAFDHLRAARILSAMVTEPLLDPERAARPIAFADRQEGALSLTEVLETIRKNTWDAPRDPQPRERSLRRVTQSVALDALRILGASAKTTPEARALVLQELEKLKQSLSARHDSDPVGEAHLRQAERDIARYLEDPAAHAPKSAAPEWGRGPRSRYPLPPGAPLGGPSQ